jgi:hypothetical protein
LRRIPEFLISKGRCSVPDMMHPDQHDTAVYDS